VCGSQNISRINFLFQSAKRGCRAELGQTMRFVSASGTERCQRNSLDIGHHKPNNKHEIIQNSTISGLSILERAPNTLSPPHTMTYIITLIFQAELARHRRNRDLKAIQVHTVRTSLSFNDLALIPSYRLRFNGKK
jgi:hypothetical protein